MSAVRKYKEIIDPGPVTKFFNAINPMASLGKVAGKNFHENSLTISLILLFTLIVAIITTVMFVYMEEDENDNNVNRQLILAAMAVSWFVFLNFIFLLFEMTRLFNILLFTALVTLIATATTNLDQTSPPSKLGISGIVFATIPLIILTYYYFLSEGDEVVQLKTLERERKEAEERKKAFNEAVKEKEEAIKKKLTEDVTSETGIRQKIGQAYIDALIESAKKNVTGKAKGESEKKPKDKDGEKKKEEDKK